MRVLEKKKKTDRTSTPRSHPIGTDPIGRGVALYGFAGQEIRGVTIK